MSDVDVPVDVATGDVVLAETDAMLPGSLPLVFERSHRSSARTGRWFGRSWMSSLDQRLQVTDGQVCARFADGETVTWAAPDGAGGAAVIPATGPVRPLRREPDGSCTVSDPQRGLTWRFGRRAGYGDGELPLISVADHAGHSVHFAYDEAGRPLSIAHSDGCRILVSVTGERVTALTLAGRDGQDDIGLRRFEYDEAGELSAVFDSSGLPRRFAYDGAGLLTGWTDRNGHSHHYAFDPEGRCVRVAGHDGVLSGTFAYERGITRWTTANGDVTTYEITESGQIAAITGPVRNTRRTEYDERGRVTARIDPLGRTVRYIYGDRGDLVSVTAPDGSPLEPAGTPAAGTGATVAPDAADGTVQRQRDQLGRVVRVVGPDGATTTYTWTSEGLPASRTRPDGSTESWDWDGEGNLLRRVCASGAVTSYTYGPFDELVSVAWPDGTRTELEYGPGRHPLSVTHGGLKWHYEYDSAGRPIAQTDYNGATSQYWYDTAGQLYHRVSPSGHEASYGYDLRGNLVSHHTADGSVTTFEYDAAGRLVRAKNDDVDLVLARDSLGRVISESCNGRTVTKTYDAAGNVASRVTPSGAGSAWVYDTAGMPSVLTADGRELRFGYDSAGRETRRELPGGAVLTQEWNQVGRLVSQILAGSAAPGQLLQRRAYTYNPDGFVTGVEDPIAGARTFTLDAAGRVTGVTGEGWSEQYDYDPAGNIVKAVSPSSQGAREIDGTLTTRVGDVRYRHDAAGRVITRTRTQISGESETWRYIWDADGRLYSAVLPDGSTWHYQYDPIGRRIGKRHTSADGQLLEQTRFSWDGNVLAEQEVVQGDSEKVTTWHYRPGSAVPLAQTFRGAGEEFCSVVTDHSGMPTELVSLDGAIVGDQQHTSLGQVVRQGGTASTPWRFPGQYYDQETGLHYDNQRYYDPETGAYLSPHPLGLMAVPNPHTYAPNLLTINWIGSRLSSSHRLPLSAGVDGFDARLFSGGGRVAAESAASERLDWYTVEPPNPWE